MAGSLGYGGTDSITISIVGVSAALSDTNNYLTVYITVEAVPRCVIKEFNTDPSVVRRTITYNYKHAPGTFTSTVRGAVLSWGATRAISITTAKKTGEGVFRLAVEGAW